MTKCDFCEKWQQGSDGKFKCNTCFPSDYCREAIDKMIKYSSTVMAAENKIEKPKVEQQERPGDILDLLFRREF